MKDNEQHAIDAKVRQALENIEIPYKADHWEMMAGKLAALDAEETAFDNQLSAKLNPLEVPLKAGHWAMMVGKLAVLDAEESQFDNDLAAKLAHIEAPYQAANWADMSARLADLDQSENHFDDLFSHRLAGLEAKYQPQHWDMMAEKIEETFSWRAKIMRYKVVEVALVLLTLFTVGNMLDLPFDFSKENNIEEGVKNSSPSKGKEIKPFNHPTDWRNRPVTPNNTPIKTNDKPVVSTDNKNVDIVPNKVIAETTTANLKSQSSDNGVNDENIKTAQTAISENPTNQKSVITETIVASKNDLQIERYTEGVLKDIPLRKVLAIGRVTDGYEEVLDENHIGAVAVARILQPMDVLKPSLLNTDFYDENVIFPRQKEIKAKLRLNIFGLPSADLVSYKYVNTERDVVTNKQITSNLGTGVGISYKKNKLEVETGLTYLDKKYDLPNVEVITGSFLRGNYSTEKPLSLHLSILSIPLSMNYTVKESQRWRLYTRVGAALNTIFKTKEETFTTGTNSNKSYSNYEPNIYPTGVWDNVFFKNLNWLNGGFKKNTYLTANVGVGVEYQLTHNLDIYLQPTYDYHFSKRGIGTLNDRINSLSFQGGVKMKLK